MTDTRIDPMVAMDAGQRRVSAALRVREVDKFSPGTHAKGWFRLDDTTYDVFLRVRPATERAR